MKLNKSLILGASVCAFLMPIFSGCGDDSSSGGDESLEESSSSVVESDSSVVLSDFEDGDTKAWKAYDDKGGSSMVSLSVVDGAQDSKSALEVYFTLGKAAGANSAYVGVNLDLSSAETDFSNMTGISYCYEGYSHYLQIRTSDVKDGDYYGKQLPGVTGWNCVTISFKDFAQQGSGKKVDFVAKNITALDLKIEDSKNVVGHLDLDNVSFVSGEVKTVIGRGDAKEDLKLLDPVIPSVTIGNIDMSTVALQKKAMTYLDKGVNITNWLENAGGKFNGKYLYGEKDIKTMAAHGVKALRLPIDLDLYVTNKADFLAAAKAAHPNTAKGEEKTGDEIPLEMDTEVLFGLLDNFDKWTKENGISLIIDYHEYDNSYNNTSAKDSAYIYMMANVWKTVAAHYASSEREDLFYELLNEPDMKNGQVTSKTWTGTAKILIDYIRSVDTQRTIIFGDASWYSIRLLIKNTLLPFEDKNVIYAVHTYEPFLFTHQSGSWTDYGSIKGVMFPYSKEHWSTYSVDFGVNETTKAYVKEKIENYYKEGNKEAILEQLYQAKQWAVTNKVPVILNEFGALNIGSDETSRYNYYVAMGEICSKLQIPWQHWGYKGNFSVFNNDGSLIKGMDKALGLKP